MSAKKKRRTRAAIIFGGVGSEREVSIAGFENILSNLDYEKYIPYKVEIDRRGRWLCLKGKDKKIPVHPIKKNNHSGFLENGKFVSVPVAFPILHGKFGEDGRIQGLLESLGFSFVGCGVFSGALCFDKVTAKIIAESLGIPTVKWIAPSSCDVNEALLLAEDKIGYPMFIKPRREGSSFGAYKVLCRQDFLRFYSLSVQFGESIIEEYIENKRELEAAYIELNGKDIISPLGEVVCDGFYDYGEKYSKSSKAKILARADVSDEINGLAKAYIEKLKSALSITQISRFDFFLCQDKLYLNEINTMPGFTQTSLYSRMLSNLGITSKDLISALLLGAKSYARRA